MVLLGGMKIRNPMYIYCIYIFFKVILTMKFHQCDIHIGDTKVLHHPLAFLFTHLHQTDNRIFNSVQFGFNKFGSVICSVRCFLSVRSVRFSIYSVYYPNREHPYSPTKRPLNLHHMKVQKA